MSGKETPPFSGREWAQHPWTVERPAGPFIAIPLDCISSTDCRTRVGACPYKKPVA